MQQLQSLSPGQTLLSKPKIPLRSRTKKAKVWRGDQQQIKIQLKSKWHCQHWEKKNNLHCFSKSWWTDGSAVMDTRVTNSRSHYGNCVFSTHDFTFACACRLNCALRGGRHWVIKNRLVLHIWLLQPFCAIAPSSLLGCNGWEWTNLTGKNRFAASVQPLVAYTFKIVFQEKSKH